MRKHAKKLTDDIAELKKKMAESSSSKAWCAKPFVEFIDYSHRLSQLLDLSMNGISTLRARPQVIKAITKANEFLGEMSDSPTDESLEEANDIAELAQREVDEGFPILLGQATVSIWAALESTVRLFVVRWLENFPDALNVEVVRRLRVRIGEYESLQGEDRFFYIVDQLERETSAPLSQGITRFELLLKPFGLDGAIDDSTRKTIFELNQVRNVIVHRSGKVDRRFVEACPWKDLAIGDLIAVNRDTFHQYEQALLVYINELMLRTHPLLGIKMSEKPKHLALDIETMNASETSNT